MKQKIVMKVHMSSQKYRTKAFKIVATAHGVTFVGVGLEGEEKDKLMVFGDGVDVVKLANCLRKKVGQTEILSLEHQVHPLEFQVRPPTCNVQTAVFSSFYH